MRAAVSLVQKGHQPSWLQKQVLPTPSSGLHLQTTNHRDYVGQGKRSTYQLMVEKWVTTRLIIALK